MSLFVIGDLHLCLGVPDKPMDVFNGWNNYQELIKKNWLENIRPDDTIVLAGDISWAMSLQQAYDDFKFINDMPGRKIILKGNHDYWWTTKNKMDLYFKENNFDTIYILHNNHFKYENYGICGTRGWVNMPNEPSDAKVLAREAQRLEVSVKVAVECGLEPIVFMHYPPIYGNNFNYDILDVLYRYNVKKCYYGHIHGKGHSLGVKGFYDNIFFSLISSDYLQFIPEKVI